MKKPYFKPFVFLIISFFACSLSVQAAVLRVSPSTKELSVGQQFAVRVYVSSEEQAMNAVSGALTFPSSLAVEGVSLEGSIIDLWTIQPEISGKSIRFEGIALNPGYQGTSGTIFTVVFTARSQGPVTLSFTNAAILANDGLGSNILASVGSGNYSVQSGQSLAIAPVVLREGPIALPVITEYSSNIGARESAYIKGIGEPGALTKIVFKNVSLRSIGEQFIAALQTKKQLDEVLVKNDPETGAFEFSTDQGLVAGAYNATPFLVDESTNTEKPGLGVQLFVSDSKIVRILVVLVNILALLIPVVGLGVLIYFIPWYSFRRMRVIKRKLGLEEEKLALSVHGIKREDERLDSESPHNTTPPPFGSSENVVQSPQ